MKAQVYKDPRPAEHFDRFHARTRARAARLGVRAGADGAHALPADLLPRALHRLAQGAGGRARRSSRPTTSPSSTTSSWPSTCGARCTSWPSRSSSSGRCSSSTRTAACSRCGAATTTRRRSRPPTPILARGDIVVMYAEAGRSRTGELGKPRHGLGRLALESGAPVVPDRDRRHRASAQLEAAPVPQGDGAVRRAAALRARGRARRASRPRRPPRWSSTARRCSTRGSAPRGAAGPSAPRARPRPAGRGRAATRGLHHRRLHASEPLPTLGRGLPEPLRSVVRSLFVLLARRRRPCRDRPCWRCYAGPPALRPRDPRPRRARAASPGTPGARTSSWRAPRAATPRAVREEPGRRARQRAPGRAACARRSSGWPPRQAWAPTCSRRWCSSRARGHPDARASDDLEGAVGLTQILAGTATDLLGMRVDVAAQRAADAAIARAERAAARAPPAARRAAPGRRALRSRQGAGGARALPADRRGALRRRGAGGGLVPHGHRQPRERAGRATARTTRAGRRSTSTRRRDRPARLPLLSGFGDDSATYLWRVYAAREIMRLYREDHAGCAAGALQTAKASAEEVLHPRSRRVFETPDELEEGYRRASCGRSPASAACGSTARRRAGRRLDAERRSTAACGRRRTSWPSTWPRACATSGTQASLIVTSTVRDLEYQRVLLRATRSPRASTRCTPRVRLRHAARLREPRAGGGVRVHARPAAVAQPDRLGARAGRDPHHGLERAT